MHPDAEPALVYESLLEQAGEVGADALVSRCGVFGPRVVRHEGHECLHGTI